MLYRRGQVWWYKFKFAGRAFVESAKTSSKEIARRAELKRRRELEEGFHGLKKREAPQTLTSPKPQRGDADPRPESPHGEAHDEEVVALADLVQLDVPNGCRNRVAVLEVQVENQRHRDGREEQLRATLGELSVG